MINLLFSKNSLKFLREKNDGLKILIIKFFVLNSFHIIFLKIYKYT